MKSSAKQRHIVAIYIILNIFWLLMSGKWDLFHITIGLVATAVVTWVTLPTLTVTGNCTGKSYYMFDMPWLKLIKYWIWLLGQIVVANFQVARIVLDPRLPIEPQVVNINKKFDNPIAQTTLANSIIVTPGTLTLDIVDGEYTIHTLTKQSVTKLQSPGDSCIITKVEQVFTNDSSR